MDHKTIDSSAKKNIIRQKEDIEDSPACSRHWRRTRPVDRWGCMLSLFSRYTSLYQSNNRTSASDARQIRSSWSSLCGSTLYRYSLVFAWNNSGYWTSIDSRQIRPWLRRRLWAPEGHQPDGQSILPHRLNCTYRPASMAALLFGPHRQGATAHPCPLSRPRMVGLWRLLAYHSTEYHHLGASHKRQWQLATPTQAYSLLASSWDCLKADASHCLVSSLANGTVAQSSPSE